MWYAGWKMDVPYAACVKVMDNDVLIPQPTEEAPPMDQAHATSDWRPEQKVDLHMMSSDPSDGRYGGFGLGV